MQDANRNRLVQGPTDPQVLDEDGQPCQVNVTINMSDPSEFRSSNAQIAARIGEAIRVNRNRYEAFDDGPGQLFAGPKFKTEVEVTNPTAPNVLGPPKRDIRL